MKATGVVRRMDDLGRIVIPKEIRRTLMIREGDSMEIFIGSGGEILLKKYSTLGPMTRFAEIFAKVLATQTGKTAMVVDLEKVLTVAGEKRAAFAEVLLSERMKGLMEEHRMFVTHMGEKMFAPNVEKRIGAFAIMSGVITISGDAVGAVVLCAREKEEFDEVDKALVQSGCKLLAEQLEV